MKKVSEQSIVDGSAWEAFCESLKRAGQVATREDMPANAHNRIAGVRYLTGLLSSSIDLWLNAADPEHPQFVTVYGPHKGWALANPDAHYQRARLRGDRRYRVWGTRGTVPYLGFELSKGIWSYSKPEKILGGLSSRTLQVEPDGTWEIILASEEPSPRPKNWAPITPDVEWLHIRQFFNDWNAEELAEIQIECLDAENEVPALSEESLAQRLDDVAWFVEEEARLWADYILHMRGLLGNNVFPPPTAAGGDSDEPLVSNSGAPENQYSQGYYVLEEDEALIVELAPPSANYWNLQLGNLWYEALNFARVLSSYNGHQAVLDGQGVFRAVIAHRDPGVPNWLDTSGHREGVMLVRFQFPETPAPQAQTRLVKFDELASALPADTPRIRPAARRAELALRSAGVARRFR